MNKVIILVLSIVVNIKAQINVGSGGQFGSFYPSENDLEDYCYRLDEEPYIFFGTKTSYDSLTKRGGNQHNVPGSEKNTWFIRRSCVCKQLQDVNQYNFGH